MSDKLSKDEIREIAAEVSQVGPAPKREGNGMVTWKFLIPILVALSGVVGTAMLLSTAAAVSVPVASPATAPPEQSQNPTVINAIHEVPVLGRKKPPHRPMASCAD